MKLIRLLVFGACSFGVVLSCVNAESVIDIVASKDNTIFDATTDLANGSGEHFFVGKNSGNAVRRSLIAFDLTDVTLPASQLTGASVIMNMSRTNSAAQEIHLHRLNQDWGEGASDAPGGEGGGAAAEAGDATWDHTFFPNQNWGQPGGDFQPAASATVSVVAEGLYTWDSSDLLADVQSWLANPSTNFGWILVGSESEVGQTKRFDSRNNLVASVRPRLQLSFSDEVLGDFNDDSTVDVLDIELLSAAVRAQSNDLTFDLNSDDQVSEDDRTYWIVEVFNTYVGDSNLDGEFNSTDMIVVFQSGEYEDGIAGNSTWTDGDWNGDAEFDSSDFIFGFRLGGYEVGPRPAKSVPEPTHSHLLLAFLGVVFASHRNRHCSACNRVIAPPRSRVVA